MIISKKHRHFLPILSKVTPPLSVPLLSILVLTAFLTSCDSFNNGSKSAASKSHSSRSSVHRVDAISIDNKPVSLEQTVSGTLEAVTKIRLYNEESGRIIKMTFHEGDSVKKGTLLVQLDNELLKTDVDKAKASREQAKVNLSRLKKLLPKKISTEEEVANARTELDLAIAEEKLQVTRLKRTSIKAPIDGLITARLYEPGDMLPQQSHIHTIIDPESLRLKASLAERWIPLVEKGQSVSLRIDALGDKKFDAEIIRIHPTINTSTHKGIIEIQLSPVPQGASVGQFARAKIELKATDRLVVPAYTIQYEPEGAFIYRVIENDKGESVAEKVSLEQGQQFGAVTEILEGLNTGDQVVSRGFLGLRDGKKVEVANADDLPATSSAAGAGNLANDNKPSN
jgi:RND family efflux transporter MFP subunit